MVRSVRLPPAVPARRVLVRRVRQHPGSAARVLARGPVTTPSVRRRPGWALPRRVALATATGPSAVSGPSAVTATVDRVPACPARPVLAVRVPVARGPAARVQAARGPATVPVLVAV